MNGYRLVLLIGMLLLVVLACGVVQVISITFGWALGPYSTWSVRVGDWDVVKLEEDLDHAAEHDAYRERLMRMGKGWDSRSGEDESDESDDGDIMWLFGPSRLGRPPMGFYFP